MYWADAVEKKIEYANLDGSSRTVLVTNIGQARGLFFYQNQLFVADDKFARIIVLNVTSETNSSVYTDGFVGVSGTFKRPYDILIFSESNSSADTQGTVSNDLLIPY